MVRQIPLSQGKVALVDDDDHERVARHKWSAARNGKHWYAKRIITQGGHQFTCYLHRFILGVPDGVRVDHQNGDGLDCRKHNMRLGGAMQNAWNTRVPAHNTSGYKGVGRHHDRWKAQITAGGKTYALGIFDTAEAAARHYDAAARHFFGQFARTNFGERDPEAEAELRRRLASWGAGKHVGVSTPKKLTDDQVRAIRRRYLAGLADGATLAAEYGVTDAAIYHCLSGRTFAHVTDPPPIKGDKRNGGVRHLIAEPEPLAVAS